MGKATGQPVGCSQGRRSQGGWLGVCPETSGDADLSQQRSLYSCLRPAQRGSQAACCATEQLASDSAPQRVGTCRARGPRQVTVVS